jgi:hypothetical protein
MEKTKNATIAETVMEATMLAHILDFTRIGLYLKMVTALGSTWSRAPV